MTTLLALQAERNRLTAHIEALWRVANNPSSNDEETVHAMLQNGAAAIRPAQPFRGLLARIEGAHMRLESLTEAPGQANRLGAENEWAGALVALSDTVFAGRVIAVERTYACDDLQTSDRLTPSIRAHGWRAMIATSFSAGGSTYILSFASHLPAATPFGPQDRAFVEVLAAFFAAHCQQRWQSARIGHHLERDSLTSLWNRSRFRSLGRTALGSGGPAAIAVIDLVNFHQLNETNGHLAGDAVLVEVAAALTAKVRDDEIIARVGGDSFGIFFPSVPSPARITESVARYQAVFDEPVSIGDREGKETVRVTATVGCAMAPRDGTTFDALLFAAEGRAVARPERSE